MKRKKIDMDKNRQCGDCKHWKSIGCREGECECKLPWWCNGERKVLPFYSDGANHCDCYKETNR